jgi:hypothetical protein
MIPADQAKGGQIDLQDAKSWCSISAGNRKIANRNQNLLLLQNRHNGFQEFQRPHPIANKSVDHFLRSGQLASTRVLLKETLDASPPIKRANWQDLP